MAILFLVFEGISILLSIIVILTSPPTRYEIAQQVMDT
jgi:hypothetical protein